MSQTFELFHVCHSRDDESDAVLVRAEVGDLDEIMGCFPHLQKEEEAGGSDGMDSSEQTDVVDVPVGTGEKGD